MKLIATLRIDNMIDLITNSSSELFTIRAEQPIEFIKSLVEEALSGVIGYSFDVMYMENSDGPNDESWQIEHVLGYFPEDKREEIRTKYFSTPQYYCVITDRDESYRVDYLNHSKLAALGFELINSDY